MGVCNSKFLNLNSKFTKIVLKFLIEKVCNMKKTRMTHQRRMILEQIETRHNHVTAEAVYERLKAGMPDLSLSTVYRNLKTLADEGKISVSDLGGGLVYEAVDVPHHHLVCLSCDRVQTLNHGLVQPLFDTIQAGGFQVATTHLIIYGYCDQCRKNT
jgi:Fe2+ or Zn2+ uptake regulation protein